jgi:hypothetical protein
VARPKNLSFREKKLHLKAQLPVGATLPRLHNVGIGCQLSINRQLAEPEKACRYRRRSARPNGRCWQLAGSLYVVKLHQMGRR